jgi:hypothetical protein
MDTWPILIGVGGLLTVIAIWVLWARKLPKQDKQ